MLEPNALEAGQVFLPVLRLSLANNHSTNSYQWAILIIRMSGLEERYNAALCTLPVDLTPHISIRHAQIHIQ